MNLSLKSKREKGFTLIELLVVIAIIGLLASAVMLLATGAKTKAKDAKVVAEMRSIRLALEDYAITNGGYPKPGSYNDPNTGVPRYDWCIGATDCILAGLDTPKSTVDWPANLQNIFPSYPNNVSFIDADLGVNKGYVYVSCKTDGSVCPENPTASDSSDVAYLIYSKTSDVKSLKVGTFVELSCSLDPQCKQSHPGWTCGPANNDDCSRYSYQANSCNYDPNGTGAPTTCSTCEVYAACNYEQIGPCEFSSCGYCNNPNSCNFHAAGRCDYSCLSHCTDPNACNNGANEACDYSCFGTCEDWGACNYGGINPCDYSCITYGCTDFGACNYDSSATFDDGSCEYESCIGGNNTCGPQNNVSCALYTSENTGACNYDIDGTGAITVMCNCGPAHNNSCNNWCGNPFLGSCKFDSNGNGQAGSVPCEDFTSCRTTCIDPTACNFGVEDLCNYDCWTIGCTDSHACNYDANAHTDDGSCDYSCFDSCTDPNACNYGNAGSCEYTSCITGDIWGCTDPNANNYDPTANIDDGSCAYGSYGCTDPGANNYDSLANIDNGSCTYDAYGCTDPGANNYDSLANIDDGSCAYDTYGCTDGYTPACNYNSNASIDDGSCDYSCYL